MPRKNRNSPTASPHVAPTIHHNILAIHVSRCIRTQKLHRGTVFVLFSHSTDRDQRCKTLDKFIARFDGDTALAAHMTTMIFGSLIVFFLIVEPHGIARLWSTAKEKLRLWPFPH